MDTQANNLNTLERAIRLFVQTMKRPQTWTLTTQKAGVSIDRPAATILMILSSDATKSFTPHELTERLLIEAPSVTRKLQQLETDRFIVRTNNLSDRRSVGLQITNLGLTLAHKIQAIQRDNLQSALACLSATDQKTFVDMFATFSSSIADVYSKEATLNTTDPKIRST
jgi:DNA-binding MarR family transcriptional regulator